MNNELEVNILTKLYESFFENYVIGMTTNGIIQQFSNYSENDVKKAINELEYQGQIYRDGTYWKISTNGIAFVEDELGGDSDRKEQRMKILEILRNAYDENVDQKIKREVFIEKLKLENPNDILSQMKHLENLGYVDLELAMGGYFSARLTVIGWHFLND